MIKNIVLDMGNVLLDYNPQVPLDLFCGSEAEKEAIYRELFCGPEWVQGDLGNITNDERYESVRRRISSQMHPALKRCVYEWSICMKPVFGAREFCGWAKDNGYRLYVLSNASDEFYQYFPEFLPFDYFDGIVISSDLHMIKPDAGIYRHLLQTYDLIPEECLFIDDRAENVEGAKKEGMAGVVFGGDFEEIKEAYLEIDRAFPFII